MGNSIHRQFCLARGSSTTNDHSTASAIFIQDTSNRVGIANHLTRSIFRLSTEPLLALDRCPEQGRLRLRDSCSTVLIPYVQ